MYAFNKTQYQSFMTTIYFFYLSFTEGIKIRYLWLNVTHTMLTNWLQLG